MPGFIDDHNHIGSIRRNVIGYEDWGLRARLAFGVTTAFDPSTLGIDQIAYQALIDAGLMVRPRLRSTGTALFSKERFTSLGQVHTVLSGDGHSSIGRGQCRDRGVPDVYVRVVDVTLKQN